MKAKGTENMKGSNILYKVFIILVSLLFYGCGLYRQQYIVRNPIDHKTYENVMIHVYGISTKKNIKLWRGNNWGDGADLRLVSDMLTASDKAWITTLTIFALGLPLFINKPQFETASVEPSGKIKELQNYLGEKITLINETKNYSNEKSFIQAKKKGEDFYVIYHTCDLENYPVYYDVSLKSNVSYKVPVATVRVNLYYDSKKILDYRDSFISKRVKKLADTLSEFESHELIDMRRSENSAKQILNATEK